MRSIITAILVLIMAVYRSLYGNYTGNVVTDMNSIEITSQDDYDVIMIQDVYEVTKEIGNPQLPCKTLTYLLPLESSVESITIISTQIETMSDKLYNVFPVQPPRGTDGETDYDFVEPNEDVYSSGLLYPSDICKIKSQEFRLGYHVVTIEFYPIQYDTGTKELKIHTGIDFVLNYKNTTESCIIPEKQSEKVYNLIKNIIKSQVENPNDIDFISGGAKEIVKQSDFIQQQTNNKSMPALPEFMLPEYVIITSKELQNEFQILADWKIKKGVPTIIAYTEDIIANYSGDIKERIKAYLAEIYGKYGIIYVLLGGDLNIIPTDTKCDSYDEFFMELSSTTAGFDLYPKFPPYCNDAGKGMPILS